MTADTAALLCRRHNRNQPVVKRSENHRNVSKPEKTAPAGAAEPSGGPAGTLEFFLKSGGSLTSFATPPANVCCASGTQ